MKKNSGGNSKFVQVDPITGEYYTLIPEWVINELDWYEDTEIYFNVEGNEVVLTTSRN